LKSTELPTGPSLVVGPEGATPAPELTPKEAGVTNVAAAAGFDKAGMIDDAITYYQKARQLDPEGQKAVCRRLAVLYDKKGEFIQASTEYELALQLTPNDPDLHNDLGYSHYLRGDWAKAEEHFAKATKFAPTHKRAWMNRGMALVLLGRSDEGLQCFRKVVSEAEARANLAFLLGAQGQAEAAKAEYRQALRLAPELQVARAALDSLENPPREATPPPAVPAKPATKATATARVPSIQELGERLDLESKDMKPISIDPSHR
jgi:Flp pilus assembly protein TadD